MTIWRRNQARVTAPKPQAGAFCGLQKNI